MPGNDSEANRQCGLPAPVVVAEIPALDPRLLLLLAVLVVATVILRLRLR